MADQPKPPATETRRGLDYDQRRTDALERLGLTVPTPKLSDLKTRVEAATAARRAKSA